MVETDLVSLAAIAAVALICPIIAQAIPRQLISETVFLLVFGMILGPYLLDIIKLSDSISLLSDLGLGFLFLLAGYEINPQSIIGHQGRYGLVTWFITLGLAALVVIVTPLFSLRDMDGVAVSIALTTTAIGTLLPILSERGLLHTEVGESILAYGTWGELAPVFAMTVLLSTRAEWLTIAILAVFVVIAVITAIIPHHARKVGSYFFKIVTVNANTNAQLIIRATVLLMVGLTAISAVFDLDIVLGSFAAGFILRYIVPEGNQLMEDKLNSIAFGFFIPLFFITSGAKIEVTSVLEQPGLVVGFIVMLLLVRALPIFIALKIDKETRHYDLRTRTSIAIYCTTALPIIVAVTTVAVNAGAMTSETASILVASGGITVLVMPALSQIVLRTIDAEPISAAKEIVETPHRFRDVLRRHRTMEVARHHAERQQRLHVQAANTVEKFLDSGMPSSFLPNRLIRLAEQPNKVIPHDTIDDEAASLASEEIGELVKEHELPDETMIEEKDPDSGETTEPPRE